MALFFRRFRTLQAPTKALLIVASVVWVGCPARESALEKAVEREKLAAKAKENQTGEKAPPPPVAIAAAESDGERVDWPKNPGYAGVDSCVECHKERVADFRETRHAQACRRPTTEDMGAGFKPGNNVVPSQFPGVRFEMSRRDNDFYVSIIRPSQRGKSVRDDRKIDFVYGLGQPTDEGYFSFDGEFIYELPVSWMPKAQEWGVTYFDALPGQPGRATTFRCMECHNTWFAHKPGTTDRYDPHSFMLGVQCESCHGPAQRHVDHHRAAPNDKSGRHVVVPSHLPRDRSIDLCATCHSNAMRHKTEPLSFRPGDKLDDHFRSLTLRHPENDHVANQTDYLKQSKCFQNSDMTCVTCHNPHLSRERQDASGCAKCHQNEACKERSRLPEGVRDSCVACHMPTRQKIQVAFNTATDRHVSPVPRWEHRIAVYPEARDETLWKWHSAQNTDESRAEAARLKQALAEFWSKERDARASEGRGMAAIERAREAVRFDDSEAAAKTLIALLSTEREAIEVLRQAQMLQTAGKLDASQTAFRKVLELEPNNNDAHAALGTLLARIGKIPEAKKSWAKARTIDPDDVYPASMLAWQTFLEGDIAGALEQYEKLFELQPDSGKVLLNWGIILADQGRHEEALERYERAARLDRQDPMIPNRTAASLRALGRPSDALPQIERALRLSQGDLETMLMWVEILYECRRVDEGDRAAKMLLQAANARFGPNEVAELEQRLIEKREGRNKP